MHCWNVASIDGLLATPLLQNTPGASGGNCKMPPGKGVGGVLASEGSPGLASVAGVMADWCLGAASMRSGLPLASSQAASNILATRCWLWV